MCDFISAIYRDGMLYLAGTLDGHSEVIRAFDLADDAGGPVEYAYGYGPSAHKPFLWSGTVLSDKECGRITRRLSEIWDGLVSEYRAMANRIGSYIDEKDGDINTLQAEFAYNSVGAAPGRREELSLELDSDIDMVEADTEAAILDRRMEFVEVASSWFATYLKNHPRSKVRYYAAINKEE